MPTPMIAALRECSLYELELIVLALLPLEGFGEAELLDRRQNSQRTRYGGFEIICHRISSFLQHTTLVKVINDDVRQRMVCEMAGEVDLFCGDVGLIVSPCEITKSAKAAVQKITKSRVTVLNGAGLERLMRKHGFGVTRDDTMNREFFSMLKMLAKATENKHRSV